MQFRKFIFLLLFIFSGNFLSAQNNLLTIDSVGDGIEVDHVWSFQNGDDSKFSKINFDDSTWITLHSDLANPQELKKFSGLGWFRLHIKFDSILKNIPLAINIRQVGAMEIYFDGEKIGGCGKVSANEKEEEGQDMSAIPIPFNYNAGQEHVFAIRFSNHDTLHSYVGYGEKVPGFQMDIVPAYATFSGLLSSQTISFTVSFSLGCFYLVLGFVHLLLWFFYKSNKSNLYYFFFTFALGFFTINIVAGGIVSNPSAAAVLKMMEVFDITFIFITLLNLVYHLFYEKFPKRFKWYFLAGIISSLLVVFQFHFGMTLVFSFCFSATIDTIFTVIVAVRRRKRGSKIIASGILFFTGFVFLILFSGIFGNSSVNIHSDSFWGICLIVVFFMASISIPVSMSVYLAKDFSETNRSLSQKLDELEKLSAKSIEQEKEKQKILESQKENLEREVTERTAEIVHQKTLIEEKNKDILASIHYAKRIQQSLLPTEKYMERNMKRLRK